MTMHLIIPTGNKAAVAEAQVLGVRWQVARWQPVWAWECAPHSVRQEGVCSGWVVQRPLYRRLGGCGRLGLVSSLMAAVRNDVMEGFLLLPALSEEFDARSDSLPCNLSVNVFECVR